MLTRGNADLAGGVVAAEWSWIDKGEVHAWPAKALQDDLLQQLSAVMTPDTVRRELIDVASGRTDITYTPQPGNRYVIEVKRRLTSATHEAVERDHLAPDTVATCPQPPPQATGLPVPSASVVAHGTAEAAVPARWADFNPVQ